MVCLPHGFFKFRFFARGEQLFEYLMQPKLQVVRKEFKRGESFPKIPF